MKNFRDTSEASPVGSIDTSSENAFSPFHPDTMPAGSELFAPKACGSSTPSQPSSPRKSPVFSSIAEPQPVPIPPVANLAPVINVPPAPPRYYSHPVFPNPYMNAYLAGRRDGYQHGYQEGRLHGYQDALHARFHSSSPQSPISGAPAIAPPSASTNSGHWDQRGVWYPSK